jgi:uncharacterized membrane protein
MLVLILRIVFGAFFAFAGITHWLKPKLFKRFIPNFLPKLWINYIVGILELSVGIGLFLTDYYQHAGALMFILMVIFLPIHIWDVFREKPAIGSKKIAYIRLPLQFVLLYIAYFIYTN